MKRKEMYLHKIVDCIIENNDDAGDSFAEYSIKCVLNGVEASLDDLNFCKFILCKSITEYGQNDLYNIVWKALKATKFLDPVKSEEASEFLYEIMYEAISVESGRHIVSNLFSYAFKNFPEAECTKRFFKIAYAFGFADLDVSLSELVEYRRMHNL